MATVFQTDKRSGITYAYASVSHWDKEKKQSRAKRTLIGRVDSVSGEIVPTDGRVRNKKQQRDLAVLDQTSTPKRLFYGATYLFDEISKKLGVTDDLKSCFPETYTQILSIAYFLILEDRNPLSRFDKWSQMHLHPYGKTIASQRSSELFGSIDEASKQKFFRLQGKRKIEKEYWAYDTTSVSSFSQQLKQVQYGKNKEDDRLAQINLALVFGESSHLPFYYRKLAGNIPDSKTIKRLLADLDVLGYAKVKLVMDRGFYSKDNVNALFKDHIKFLMAVSMSLTSIRKTLDTVYDEFRSFDYYSETYELYSRTIQTTWEYEQSRRYKGDILSEPRRLYIHYYYNIDKAAEDEKAFDTQLLNFRHELESGNRVAEHEKQYTKYFTCKTTPKRGTRATVKTEVVTKKKRYYGFFALISNQPMGSIEALEIYRTKDVVEKAFGNLKERLNMRRTLVSSERSLDGKLFVQFVALIFLSYLKKQMQDTHLFGTYTMQGALDTLDVIECFEYPGKQLRAGELLTKQVDLYKKFGINPPASL